MAYLNPAAGERREGFPAAAAIADVAEADATSTYSQDTADLVNELKSKLNAALAALRAAGIVSDS